VYYDTIHRNQELAAYDISYTNNLHNLTRLDNMIAIDNCVAVDSWVSSAPVSMKNARSRAQADISTL